MNYIILWYLSWSLEQMRILWIKASEELKPQRAEIFFSLSNLNFALDEARSVEKADLKPHQADARLWNSLIFSDPKLKSITLKLMAKIPFSICQFPDDFGRGEPLVVIGIGERYLKDAKNIIQNPNVKCETKLQGVEGLKDRLAPINLGPRSSHVHPHLILASTAQNTKYEIQYKSTHIPLLPQAPKPITSHSPQISTRSRHGFRWLFLLSEEV